MVEKRRAAQCGEQGDQGFGPGCRRAAGAPAGKAARHVVVFEGPAWPGIGGLRAEIGERFGNARGGKRPGEEYEAVGGVQAIGARSVFGHALHRAIGGDFGDGHAVGKFVQHGAQAGDEGQRFGARPVIDVALHIVGLNGGAGAGGWVVSQFLVMGVKIGDVQPEAVHAAAEPEARNFQDFLLHVRVVQIEVRLADQEIVQVELPAAGFPRPGAAAENAEPVIWRCAIRAGIGPDVVVGIGVIAGLAAGAEPGVVCAAVRINLVDNDAQALGMGGG